MKLFNASINARNVVITLVAIGFFGYLLYQFFTPAIPSEFGMLVYNDLTFIVTK